MQKAYKTFGTAEPAVGSQLSAQIEWPGGAGWFDVSGTFTGATAKVNTSVVVDAGVSGTIGISPLPAFPSG